MMRYSGTIASWVGTIIVATTDSSSALRPLNLSLAKANPAREEKNTTETVITLATIAELMRPLMKMPFCAVEHPRDVVAELTTGQKGGGTR